MLLQQAFKYQLRPTGQQQRQMLQFVGACRLVFNKALALQKQNHEEGNKFIRYESLAKLLTAWRSDPATPWLKDAPCHPLQHALKDLERAYRNFFAKRSDFPRFRKKGVSCSFRFPDSKQIKLDQSNDRIFLPKLGWLRFRNSREVLGAVRNVTVSQAAGKWFISIQTEREVEDPVHPSALAVGIDVGIVRFATLSDGTFVEPLNSFKRHQIRLRRYQRAMARKQKFSKNWKKAKAQVQKLHTRIANCRKDFLHKTSTTISKNHATVFVEDLQVSNMSESAAGTTEKPGKNVRAKAGLNRSILDQGWFEFRRQLGYKLLWRGGKLIAVPAQNTSRTCPICGHISADNRKSQARFKCVECGYENNADLVGSLNILERGHRLLACGESALSGRSVKQEPSEVTQAATA
jgi:putative transposase